MFLNAQQMDRFQEIQTFVRIVEAGSISGAAERMRVAKSVASRRLSDLESRLGVQLLQRTTRRINLTATGRSFYERCVRILADVDEAELAVTEEHAELRGALRIAVPLSFGLLHLGPAIIDFMQEHPGVRFELDFNDRQVDLVQEGFDAAIRIARLSDSSLIARRLAVVNHLVCASPGYLAQYGAPGTPPDLREHPCLVYSNAPTPETWSYTGASGEPRSIQPHVRLRSSNGDFLRDAAIAGQGVIMEPSFIVYQAIEQGLLVPVLTDYQWPTLNAYALYPQTRHLSRRVRALVDYLAQRFAGVPYWDRCWKAEVASGRGARGAE